MKMLSYPNEYIILGLILLLSGYGIVMMYSASSIYAMNIFNNYMFFFIQQVKWLILGLILMLITSQVNYQILKRFAYGLLILSWVVIIMGYFFKGNPLGLVLSWPKLECNEQLRLGLNNAVAESLDFHNFKKATLCKF